MILFVWNIITIIIIIIIIIINCIIQVPITSIDEFCDNRGIDKIDIIKIDAEENDIEVIIGSFDSLIKRKVKLLTFECWNCINNINWQSTIEILDKKYFFDCYQNGKNNILIRRTNCWFPSLFILSKEFDVCRERMKNNKNNKDNNNNNNNNNIIIEKNFKLLQ